MSEASQSTARCSGRDLHRAIADDLGLPYDDFAETFARPMATLRLLHYPVADPAAGGQLGAGEHTDYDNLTLLATDGVGGLEVRSRDAAGLQAPETPDTLVCNIGDCLMRWTKRHLPVDAAASPGNPRGRERFSVAFFLDADPDAMVACLPTCTDTRRPPKYLPIAAGDHLRARLDATYIAT